jgi:hypothetical protein
MIPKALHRAATSWKTFAVAAALFSLGLVGSTFANFSADTTESTATFASGYVGSPTSAAIPGSAGADETVTWTTPTTTGVQGFNVLGTNMGTTAIACPSASTTYPVTVGSVAGAGTRTYVATNAAGSDDGSYYCYQVQSYWTTTSWTGNSLANASASAVRIGLWPTAVALGTAGGTINRSDTIKITYNQAATISSASVQTCTSGNKVLVGASSCGSTPTVGTLTLSTRTIGANQTFTTSISGSGTTSVTITLSTNATVNLTGTGTASWSFTPSSSTQSTNGGTKAPTCTLASCNVTSVSGGF